MDTIDPTTLSLAVGAVARQGEPPSPGVRDLPLLDRMLELDPTALASLPRNERRLVRLAYRMNQGRWKALWGFCQRTIGQGWIRAVTSRHVQVHGFEHVASVPRDRPLVLVANHRSYFDLYVVMSQLLGRLDRRPKIFFPVQGRYCYQSWRGAALNAIGGFWSMFPPFFALPARKSWNDHAVDLLVDICARDPDTVIGIHPEGFRNKDPDPYSFARFQPGTGRILHRARPHVIPVFIAGLGNDLLAQVTSNFRSRSRPVRVRFGPEVALDDLYEHPDKGSTAVAIVERVMGRVRALAEEDRAEYVRG